MTVLECEYTGCTWKSTDAPVSDAIKLYEMHVKARHAEGANKGKVEKAKRPEVAADMSEEDWAYFTTRFDEYKAATGSKKSSSWLLERRTGL